MYSISWIALLLSFGVLVQGQQANNDFSMGYLTENSVLLRSWVPLSSAYIWFCGILTVDFTQWAYFCEWDPQWICNKSDGLLYRNMGNCSKNWGIWPKWKWPWCSSDWLWNQWQNFMVVSRIIRWWWYQFFGERVWWNFRAQSLSAGWAFRTQRVGPFVSKFYKTFIFALVKVLFLKGSASSSRKSWRIYSCRCTI